MNLASMAAALIAIRNESKRKGSNDHNGHWEECVDTQADHQESPLDAFQPDSSLKRLPPADMWLYSGDMCKKVSVLCFKMTRFCALGSTLY